MFVVVVVVIGVLILIVDVVVVVRRFSVVREIERDNDEKGKEKVDSTNERARKSREKG